MQSRLAWVPLWSPAFTHTRRTLLYENIKRTITKKMEQVFCFFVCGFVCVCLFVCRVRSGVLNAQSTQRCAPTSKKERETRGSATPVMPGTFQSKGIRGDEVTGAYLQKRPLISSWNINKREVAAPTGSIDSTWKELRLVTGLQSLCHRRARMLR